MTYPSSIITAHKNSNQQYCKCAVGRGYVVSKPCVLVIIHYALALLVLLSSATYVAAAPVETSLVQFNIPRQSADDSLPAFGQQANITVVYPFEDAAKHHTNRLYGNYSLKEGIYILLKGSGLHAELSADGHLIISSDDVYGDGMMNSKKNILASTIAFFVGAGGMAPGVFAQADDAAAQQSEIDEIIVTASKRGAGQSIQDTAMAISALSGDTIEKRGLVGMDDYLRTLPGVSMQDRGAGQNSIVIRGLSADPQSGDGTTGIYFGEAPLSGLGTPSSAGEAGNADIKLVDVERIEVLRGPQGTLYGSDSMAGTVRVIPVAPSLQEVEGKLMTRYSQTGEQGGDNTMIQGVINVPLIEDTLAVRAVAYRFDNSGFIDNVAVSQPVAGLSETTGTFGGVANDRDDIGSDEYTGFRLSMLWKPADSLDVTLSYLHQEIEQDGVPEVNLDLTGDYQQRRFNTGEEGNGFEFLDNEIDVASLVLNYDLGWGSLSSATSWVDYNSTLQTDFTHLSALLGPTFINRPYYADSAKDTEVFVEELRLNSQLDGPLQFVAGLYYEDREDVVDIAFPWSGDATLDSGNLQDVIRARTADQKALFGDVSYAINDQFTATLGGRYFDYEKDESVLFTFLGSPVVFPPEVTSDTGQTYKANLSYTPNEDILLYGQWVEGFRLGRGLPPNLTCEAQGIIAPDRLESDTSENMELGFKTSLADSRININVAVYRIDWEGIPILINRGSNCFTTENAGKAKSEGIELEFQGRLSANLHVGLTASYGESTLVGDSNIGDDGDNLPGSADFNASLDIQYDFALAGYDGFIRVDYAYISEYFNSVKEGESGSLAAGGFGQFNMKSGINFDQIDLDVFVNNLTNNDGVTWVETVNVTLGAGNNAYRIRPRTVGLNLSYKF